MKCIFLWRFADDGKALVVLCGVVVMINATGATTSVLVQVLGTSIFTLPR